MVAPKVAVAVLVGVTLPVEVTVFVVVAVFIGLASVAVFVLAMVDVTVKVTVGVIVSVAEVEGFTVEVTVLVKEGSIVPVSVGGTERVSTSAVASAVFELLTAATDGINIVATVVGLGNGFR